MVMGFFRGEKNLLKKLQRSDWSSDEEKMRLLKKVAANRDYKLSELAFLFQHRDSEVSEFAFKRILPTAPAEEAVGTLLQVHASSPGAGDTQKVIVQNLLSLNKEVLARQLTKQLSSPDEERAGAAFDLLRRMPRNRSTGGLWARAAQALRGPRRVEALRVLMSPDIFDEGAHGSVISALAKDPDPAVRDMFLSWLRGKGVDGFQQDILRCLADPTPKVRREALELIKAHPEGFAFEDLLPLVASSDAIVRDEVIRTLVSGGNPRHALEQILALLAEKEPAMRTRGLQSIEELGVDLFTELSAIMRGSQGLVRAMVAELLIVYERPEVLEAARILLDAEDWWTQMVALETLGKYGDAGVVPLIQKKLDDPKVFWAAIEALAALDLPEAREALSRMLGRADKATYANVVRALARQGGRQARKALLNVAKNAPDKSVREDASEVMRKTFELETILVRYEEEKEQLRCLEKLERLFKIADERGATDLHLSVGEPPMMRVIGLMEKLESPPLALADVEELVFSLLVERERKVLENELQVDLCYELRPGRRVRGNAYRDNNGLSATFRMIWNDVPTFAALGLPQVLTEIADYHQGMALFVGPSRAGKTTTLGAVLNYINEIKRHHIICLEDPIEVVHENRNCIVHQRQLGRDTKGFAEALRSALREDPDIIVIGEMRDRDTIEIACTAAETGHLVLSTLHTPTAPKAIDRLISSFSPSEQGQIRSQLADSLKFVVAQNLLKRADGNGVVAFYEVLKMSTAISNLIREQKTHLVGNQMALERNYGSIPRDTALMSLVQRSEIEPFEAYRYADDQSVFESLVPRRQLESYVGE